MQRVPACARNRLHQLGFRHANRHRTRWHRTFPESGASGTLVAAGHGTGSATPLSRVLANTARAGSCSVCRRTDINNANAEKRGAPWSMAGKTKTRPPPRQPPSGRNAGDPPKCSTGLLRAGCTPDRYSPLSATTIRWPRHPFGIPEGSVPNTIISRTNRESYPIHSAGRDPDTRSIAGTNLGWGDLYHRYRPARWATRPLRERLPVRPT